MSNIALADFNLQDTKEFGGKATTSDAPGTTFTLEETLDFGGKAETTIPYIPSTFTLIETLDFGGQTEITQIPSTFTLIETLEFGGKTDTSIPYVPSTFTLIDELSFGGEVKTYPQIYDVTPINNSVNISIYPTLRIYVETSEVVTINWSTNHTTWYAENLSASSGYYEQNASFVNESNTTYWWTVKVNTTNPHWNNQTFSFTTQSYNWSNWSDPWTFNISRPNITTLNATNITQNSATLNGNVSFAGINATGWFEYGLDTNYTNYTNATDYNILEPDNRNENTVNYLWGEYFSDFINSSHEFFPPNMTVYGVILEHTSSPFGRGYNAFVDIYVNRGDNDFVFDDGIHVKDNFNTEPVWNDSEITIWFDTPVKVRNDSVYHISFVTRNKNPSHTLSAVRLFQSVSDSPRDLYNVETGASQISRPRYANISFFGTSGFNITNNTNYTFDLTGLNSGTEYYYQFRAGNDIGISNGSNVSFMTDISNVTNFTAETFAPDTINLSWDSQVGIDSYLVRFKLNSAPINRLDGTLLCNQSNVSFSHVNLNLGSSYYYSIWTYNDTFGFNENYSTAFNYTNPGVPSNLNATNKTLISITLNWTKGINATHSVIIMNETGYSDYPNSLTNGTEVFNNTQNSTLVSSLKPNVTYYFSIWSYNSTSNLYSVSYDTENETTFDEPKAPSSFTAETYNDTIINLSWVKQNSIDSIVIFMSETSYPNLTNGIEIYNDTGTSYQKTNLNVSTMYYFTAYGFNSGVFSITNISTFNITLPSPPVNLTAELIGGTNLNITWIKGDGASHTHIRNSTVDYPDIDTGDLLYNDTGTYVVYSGATSIDYFRAWSYNDTYNLFSFPVDLLWGGLEINVYKETDPSIAITNYTVFISNQNGSETFENTSANNPFRIDVSDVPNGNDIVIQISREGYYTQTQYRDLDENRWYLLNFYLPADTGGGGDPSNPDYIPPDDDNESYGQLYLLTVQDIYNQPIQNAKMEIQRYINTTEIWETITIRYTDANGQVDVYLTPNSFYKVLINKTGYQSVSEDYIASPEILTKTFRLYHVIDEGELPESLWNGITWRIEPDYAYHTSNITLLFNISSQYGQLEWFKMEVYYYNDTNGSYSTIYSENITNMSYGGEITFTTPNESGRYGLTCWFKKANFSTYRFSLSDGICRVFFITYETISERVKDIPIDIYVLIGIVLAIAGMALCVQFGATELAGFVGIGIMIVVFMFRPDLTIGGVAWWLVMLVTGIVYAVIMFLRERI